MTRLLNLRGIAFMLLSLMLLFTACSNNNTNSGDSVSPSTNKPATSDSQDKAPATADIPDNLNMEGFPIVNEKITLTALGGQSVFSPTWNETALFKRYEELTNIHIEWDLPATTDLSERRNLRIAGQDYPDIFYSALIPANEIAKLGSQGVLIPLEDLIEQYAPNLKKLFEKYPDIRRQLTQPDGHIYTIGQIVEPEFLTQSAASKLWIHKKWLDKLGLPVPQTTEEYYQALKAFVEQDPNGNGQKDEIGYSFIYIRTLVNTVMGAYGLKPQANAFVSYSSSHPTIEVSDDQKQIRFIMTDDRYRAALEYLNKLFVEGLIDPGTFSQPISEFYVKIGGDPVAGSFLYSTVMEPEVASTYVGLPALKGPNGDQYFPLQNPSVPSPGAFGISNKNPAPEATIRWLDYFFSDEGTKMFWLGWEGETFVQNSDGSYAYSDNIMNSENMTQEIGQYLIHPGTTAPNYMMEKYSIVTPERKHASDQVKDHMPELVLPAALPFTEDEQEEWNALKTDIVTYVQEMQTQFIVGDRSFNEWDGYVKTINDMGVDRYMELYQKAFDRYMGR